MHCVGLLVFIENGSTNKIYCDAITWQRSLSLEFIHLIWHVLHLVFYSRTLYNRARRNLVYAECHQRLYSQIVPYICWNLGLDCRSLPAETGRLIRRQFSGGHLWRRLASFRSSRGSRSRCDMGDKRRTAGASGRPPQLCIHIPTEHSERIP